MFGQNLMEKKKKKSDECIRLQLLWEKSNR